ncbi:MAG: MBL fold metallo-hydrolase [Chelatococcus sp.]|nr:MBL fold metallo-hydrolase [Chelatococcus sp. HY11]MBX3547102.1 MBL fold metallo-hydrolase [Chelatococcus sp.]
MLRYPFDRPLDFGSAVEIAPELFWIRVPLLFEIEHVTCYLLHSGQDWIAIEAGPDYAPARAIWVWDSIFSFIGGADKLRRLILTHGHADHAGAAGWVHEATGCEACITAPELRDLLINSRFDTPEWRLFSKRIIAVSDVHRLKPPKPRCRGWRAGVISDPCPKRSRCYPPTDSSRPVPVVGKS